MKSRRSHSLFWREVWIKNGETSNKLFLIQYSEYGSANFKVVILLKLREGNDK